MSDSYLKTIDSIEKAYCLGFFLNIGNSKSSFADYSYELTNIDRDDDRNALNLFKNIVDIIYDVKINRNDDDEDDYSDDSCDDSNEKKQKLSMTLHDDKIFNDIKTNVEQLMTFTDDQKKGFLRGWYEYSHLMNVNSPSNGDLILMRPLIFNDDLVTKIFDFVKIPYVRLSDKIIFKFGCSSVDFLGYLYANIDDSYSIQCANYTNLIPECRFIRTDKSAIVPSKTNWSDVGFDLSIISKVKDFNSRTSLYDTGIKIDIDFGYYAEIVPRSSISKSGYILSNNIGIIDNSYRGNLMIALTKIADDAIEIEYPFRCCQLIIKKQDYVNLEEVESGLSETKRNEGGFGSTGK